MSSLTERTRLRIWVEAARASYGTVRAFLDTNRPDYDLGFAAYYGVAAALAEARADPSRSPIRQQRLADAFRILHLVQARLDVPVNTPFDVYSELVRLRTM